ncbi:MAG: calcium-binding protein, partial [Methylovulum sp.]|nr:calcium-binding protein [Methylovulum sp.]
LIASNNGEDTVYDSGGADVVKFSNMAATDIIQISRTHYDGSDLLLRYSGGQLALPSYFASADSRIEQFSFSDGTVWGWADIKAKALPPSTSNDDILFGYDDNGDTLDGLAGNDTLHGLGGNDSLNGGTGNDTLIGGVGDDSYWVDSSFDKVYEYANSNEGNDSLYSSADFSMAVWEGGEGVENLILLAGALKATGNALNNTLTGNANANRLSGGNGDDTLIGADGNDTLLGGDGNDLLIGGWGKDTLIGGVSQDNFVFNTALGADNIDHIQDFTVIDDTIQLDNAIFTTLADIGALAGKQFKIIGNGGVVDGNDRIIYNTTTGALSYDADGSGAGAAMQIAVLGKALALTAADFMVV